MPVGMGNERDAMILHDVFIAGDLGMSPEVIEAVSWAYREGIVYGASDPWDSFPVFTMTAHGIRPRPEHAFWVHV